MHPDTEQPFTLNQMASAPRRRTGLIVGIAAGAVLLIGATVAVTLAATQDHGTPAAQAPRLPAVATTAAAAAPPPATTAAAPSPAAPAPAVLKLGAKADGPNGTATAYSWKQPAATNAPKPDQDGFEWGAADVEVCAKIDGTLARDSWRLTYADHTTIEASSVGYRQFPQPEYPWEDREMTAGQCLRGWLTFAVPAGKRPATVQYQPRSFKADWQVS